MHTGFSIRSPRFIQRKRAVINTVNGTDNKCFAYAVLLCLKQTRNHPERLRSYGDDDEYKKHMNISDEDFPMTLKGVKKFEKNNADFVYENNRYQISINVYICWKIVPGEKEQNIVPVYITEEERRDHVNLLLLTNGRNSHYTWITNMSALIGAQLSKHDGRKFICNRYLRYWDKIDKFNTHRIDCKAMNNC